MLHVATKETQTESFSVETQRKICGMTMKEVIDCCSSFLLPCMLGIFTVVITLYQANLSTKQRLEDQLAAREQREQDFNVSQMQRENDRRSAESKLDLDEKLADLQRNQSEKQRAHELEIEANRYDQETEKHRHGLLTIYMNEVEALIIKYNGTITK